MSRCTVWSLNTSCNVLRCTGDLIESTANHPYTQHLCNIPPLLAPPPTPQLHSTSPLKAILKTATTSYRPLFPRLMINIHLLPRPPYSPFRALTPILISTSFPTTTKHPVNKFDFFDFGTWRLRNIDIGPMHRVCPEPFRYITRLRIRFWCP